MPSRAHLRVMHAGIGLERGKTTENLGRRRPAPRTFLLVLVVAALVSVPPLSASGLGARIYAHAETPGSVPLGGLAGAEASVASGGGPAAGAPLSCRTAGTAGSAICGDPASGPAGWVYGGPGPESLSHGGSLELAYDPAEGYTLVFATYSNASGPSSTWSYRDGDWTRLENSSAGSPLAPPGCGGDALSYDPTDDYVVLVTPGRSPGEPCGTSPETWIFSYGGWQQLSPVLSPPSAPDGSFAWLGSAPPQSGLLLFESNDLNRPWSFVAGSWTQSENVSTEAPGNGSQMYGVMTYDSTDKELLDFVGYAPPSATNQTWVYAAGEWSELSPTAAPSPRRGALLIDDPSDHDVVLLGGVNDSGDAARDVWSFSAGTWTRLVATVPYPESCGTSCYASFGEFDPLSGAIVVVTTGRGSLPVANGTLVWSYSNGTFTNVTAPSPPAGGVAGFAWDLADGYGLLQTDGGATWMFQNGNWSPVSGSPRPAPGLMAYDASDGYVLLYTDTGETWQFLGGRWAELTPLRSPPIVGLGLADDPSEGYVLLLAWTPRGDVSWEFDNGSWANLTGELSGEPLGTPANSLVFDPDLGGVVAFGTYYDGNGTNATWLFTGTGWSRLTTSGPAPPPLGAAAVAYDPAAGALVLFGGESTTDVLTSGNATWLLTIAGWARVAAGPTPPALYDAEMVYDPSLEALVLYGGYDSGSWWSWSGGPAVGPLVRAVAADPDPAEVNADLGISVDVLGGALPLTFAYAGLPEGCTSANSTSISCVPSEPGTSSIRVTVVDAHGSRSYGSLDLVVEPAPSVASFVASPASLPVGTRTVLATTVTGGSSPFTYAYSGLPDGCADQDVPLLPCVPEVSGTYSVDVLVTDSAGETALASTVLGVRPAGATGGPSIESFTASPSVVILGNGTVLAAVAESAQGPLSYSYAGLPGGCVSANSSSIRCEPSVAGAYVVTVGVAEPSGRSAEANLTLDVVPAGAEGHPIVVSFLATPALISLGTSTVLLATVSGTVAGLSFVYAGLPVGCVSTDSPSVTCRPQAAGAYAIAVTVAEPSGNRTTVPTTLAVVATAPRPSSTYAGLPAWGFAALVGLGAGLAAALGSWIGVERLALRRRRDGERWLAELSEKPPHVGKESDRVAEPGEGKK